MSSDLHGDRPADRDFPFSAWPGLGGLESAWNFSRQLNSDLSCALAHSDTPPCVACVAISGSLGRMEAHESSDLDLLVVIDDADAKLTEPQSRLAFEHIREAISRASCGRQLRPPKPGGIFSVPVSWKNLTDCSRRGVVDEDVTTYGQRMQLLLDAQPVLGHRRFMALQQDLLSWYSEQRVAAMMGEAGPFHWLWQDVQRYWRSIRSRASWLHQDAADRALEVNLKLRSSRLVIVAAFLLSISKASKQSGDVPDRIGLLCEELAKTPLERLVQHCTGDPLELLGSYQQLWVRVKDIVRSDTCATAADRAAMQQLSAWLCDQLPTHEPDWIF